MSFDKSYLGCLRALVVHRKLHRCHFKFYLLVLLFLISGLITQVLAKDNFGSLTTTFTPPSSCTSAFLPCELCTVAEQAQTCGSKHFGDDSECWPPQSPETSTAYFIEGFYSPAVACPAGYTTACQATHGGNADFTFDFPPSASETAVGCCPSAYSCTTVALSKLCGAVGCDKTLAGRSDVQKCVSTAQSTEYKGFVCFEGKVTPLERTVPAVGTIRPTATMPTEVVEVTTITSDKFTSATTATLEEENTIHFQITAFVPSISVFAPLVQLVHQRTDMPAGSSENTAAVGEKGNSSLSAGAKAGIGIGSTIAGLALIGGAFLLLSRRRNSKQAKIAKRNSYVMNLQDYGHLRR